MQYLFSYGTLQLKNVQIETYGRVLKGSKDTLNNYKLEKIKITDKDVLAKSNQQFHPIAIPSENSKDYIEGVIFEITEQELVQTDLYEVSDYKRVLETFKSNKKAWIFITTKKNQESMKKLKLHFEEEFQGKFELKKLNLLLVFQVNCPGCFSYALPFFNKLYHEFNSEEVSFLAVSTAFEDFDKNTSENTKELVKKGTLVGETKKTMNNQGLYKLPYPLDFPIVMDKMSINRKEDLKYTINAICNINPNYILWPEFEKKAIQKRVKDYLNSLDKIALTFTLNQLKGTPSFVLFNSEFEILKEWFGHISYEEVSRKLIQHK